MSAFAVTAIVAIAGPAFGGPSEVVDTHADIAEAAYVDSLTKAEELRQAVSALVSAPSAATMQAARETWFEAHDDPDAGVAAMPTGMSSLSYGEQAVERMKLGPMLNDAEKEHDCFSDNTHNSHYYDGLGISGPSLSALVAEADPAVDAALRAVLDRTMAALGQIETVEAGYSHDRMLERGNDAGEALIMGAVDAQTREIQRAVAALEFDRIGFEGSGSLDNPDGVFQ